MRVSFKDFSGMGVEGELEFLIPYLNNNGKIHNLCVGVDFGNGSSMASSYIKLEDLSLWADEDEPRTLYPHDVVQKLKNEKARLKKENEQFYNDNEELRKKLTEYEQHAKFIKDVDDLLKKSYPPLKESFEPSQGFKDFIKGLQDYTAKLEIIPSVQIPVVHLNSFEDCQKLEGEPIKPKTASSSTEFKNNNTAEEIKKNVTSLNLSLDCVSTLGIVYEEDGEEKTQEVDLQKLALEALQKQNEELQEQKGKLDNYDEIINRLLKFRTRVQHEHIQFRNGLLELIDIVLKLAREVQSDNL